MYTSCYTRRTGSDGPASSTLSSSVLLLLCPLQEIDRQKQAIRDGHRFNSFAPETANSIVRSHVDGVRSLALASSSSFDSFGLSDLRSSFPTARLLLGRLHHARRSQDLHHDSRLVYVESREIERRKEGERWTELTISYPSLRLTGLSPEL